MRRFESDVPENADLVTDVFIGRDHNIEFAVGIVVNVWFGWDVWNYSRQIGNVMGQICLPYSVLWMFLSLIIIFVDDGIRHFLFGEELPEYRLF